MVFLVDNAYAQFSFLLFLMYNSCIMMRHSASLPKPSPAWLGAAFTLMFILAGCASPAAPAEFSVTLDLRPSSTETPAASFTPTVSNTPAPTSTRTVTPTFTWTPRPTRTPTRAPTRTSTAAPPGTLTPTPIQMPAGPFKAVLRLEEITPGLVTAIHVLPDGEEILITGTFGMVRIDAVTLKTFSARYWGRSLGVDPSGTAWALPLDGAMIAAWQDNTWRENGFSDGWVLSAELPKTPVSSPQIVSGAGEDRWLATARDVRRYDGRRWTIYPADSTGVALPYKAGVQSALTVTASPTSREAWAGSCNWQGGQIVGGGGLRYFDGRRWQESGFPHPAACILSLQTGPAGVVWAASGSSLWRYDPADNVWREYSPPRLPDTQQYSYILELVLGPHGEACPLLSIQDSQNRPLKQIRYCLNGETWQVIRELPALARQALRFTPDGSLLSFEESLILRRTADGIWQPLAEMEYAAFHVGPGAQIWLVNQTAGRPVVWQAEIPGLD